MYNGIRSGKGVGENVSEICLMELGVVLGLMGISVTVN
jgi:hypothetical protein